MTEAADPQKNQQSSSDTKQFPWLGYVLGAVGASLFATKGIVIKLALIENVDAVTTLTWRMLIATPIFVLIGTLGYRARKAENPDFKLTPKMALKTGAVGMVGYYLASYLDFRGLEHISAQLDRLILLTYPFFVVLIGVIFLGRKINLTMIGALLISYCGLAFIFARDLSLSGDETILGTSMVLAAALAFATYQILAKPLIDKLGARLFTSIAMPAAGMAIILQFLATHSLDQLLVSQRAMWLMLAMGTISTVAPAYLISASIERIGPEPTAVMGNVAPLVTIALAITVLGETFSVWHALGAALVIVGILAFTRSERRTKVRPTDKIVQP